MVCCKSPPRPSRTSKQCRESAQIETRPRTKEGRGMITRPRRFVLGQTVKYTPPRASYAPPGIYVVTALLPERDGEFEYFIKHTSELHQHIAKESEVSEVPSK